ncbi:MAG: hypothetical protein ACPGUE_13710 [Marinomonas sp.]
MSKKMDIITLDQALNDKDRAELLFKGNLLVFKQRPAMLELIKVCQQQLERALSGLDPMFAQQALGQAEFIRITAQVQAKFKQDKDVRQLFFQVLEECGLDTESAYYDHFPLRVVPANHEKNGTHRSSIAHHRDTWGSNLDSQQNWWAPLYPLTQERTIAFFPKYWTTPLANNTDTWSFEDYLSKRKQTLKQDEVGYPIAPMAKEAVDESQIIKLVIEPGDVLNFASAQLHASVPNTTDAARYSVEMRTLSLEDINHGRAAPNVDNAGTTPMYNWFKRITDDERLRF